MASSSSSTSSSNGSKNWVSDAFTVEKDLRLVDNSFISGSQTDDVLRKGIQTDTWKFRPIKSNPARRTTWNEVSNALKGGTIYFNSAGSFWPSLGALCRLSSYAFGLPTNVNIYITPPGSTISVPPHTDRQDVLVFQTEGCKRWRVYDPPQRIKGKDPLNRGKGGDVIEQSHLGKPLLDVILRKGDVMYVPAGFPHTTDTTTIVEEETVPAVESVNNDDKQVFDKTSVHLTMGLDTHVWCLSQAHLRWTLLQRVGKDWKAEINDDAYWLSMKTIPVGFLSKACGSDNDNIIHNSGGVDVHPSAIEEVKRIMNQLEPNRWRTDTEEENSDKESLPSDDEIREVLSYMICHHLGTLLEIQEDMYCDVNPCDENTIIKGYHCTQKQDLVMEKYGEFSKNEAMRNGFRQRRLARERATSGAAV